MKVTCAADTRNTLGESCFWDPRDQCLWWTDIQECSVFRLDGNGSTTRFALPGRAGFILPRTQPGFVIGFADQVTLADQELRTFAVLHDVEPELRDTRINDARVDPFGGVVFGTYNETPDVSARQPVASVYRLAPSGELSRLFGNVTVSNGLAVSPDGKVMYFADTPTGLVRRFTIGEAFSSFNEIESLADAHIAPGNPDGAAVDSEGHYWSARVWGSCAARIAPDGTVSETIELPVRGPTCIAMGGPELRDMFITSLRVRHSQEELNATPAAGSVFTTRVDVPGLEQTLCLL